MFRIRSMKRLAAALMALLLCALAPGAQAEAVVGTDIGMEDIQDFYYTIDAPLAVSVYQRYRFYAEDGQKLFFHETREGGAWPLTEEHTVASGTVALTDAEWEAFCECLRGGSLKRRGDDIVDGDSGPWTYLYWTGDEGEIQEFSFASPERQGEFEALCSRLAGTAP